MTLDQAKRYRLPRGFRYVGECLAEVGAADAEYFSYLLGMPNTYGALREALQILAAEMGLKKIPDPAQTDLPI